MEPVCIACGAEVVDGSPACPACTAERGLRRPSKLALFRGCPGAYHLVKGLPEAEGSDAATEGTLLHRATASGDLAGLTNDQVDLVKKAWRFIAEVLGPEVDPDTLPADFKDCFEQHVVLREPFSSKPITWGTVDFWDRLREVLAELKFGYQEPNLDALAMQTSLYAAGAIEMSGKQGVTVHAFHVRSGTRWSRVVTYKEVDAIAKEAMDLIASLDRTDEMTFRPSAPTCLGCYCPALALCQAVSVQKALIPTKPLNVIPTKDLGEACAKLKLLIAQSELAIDHLKERMLAGETHPLWDLRTQPGRRQIEDPQAAWRAIQGALPFGAFLEATRVSVPRLEELYIETHKSVGSKASCERDFAALMGETITRGADVRVLTVKRTKKG